jgi:hypothetical protein
VVVTRHPQEAGINAALLGPVVAAVGYPAGIPPPPGGRVVVVVGSVVVVGGGVVGGVVVVGRVVLGGVVVDGGFVEVVGGAIVATVNGEATWKVSPFASVMRRSGGRRFWAIAKANKDENAVIAAMARTSQMERRFMVGCSLRVDGGRREEGVIAG